MSLVLRLCSDLVLPIDTVTQTVGILAKRRVGKSYLARKLAEQLIRAHQQIIIVDPKGDWWGIRSASDGKGDGLKIAILGGEHGDVPLEAGNGTMIAKLAGEDRVSMLLDLSGFSKEDRSLFMADFLETLYRLKAHEAYRTPVMLIIDEADEIAPQVPTNKGNEARMTQAAIDVVKRGGQRGMGCTVVTQRSASLNKNVLTQVELLIMLRTISPQDLSAIGLWVSVHGKQHDQSLLMDSLPSLPIGEAWFWSPGWPTDVGIFQRSKVLPIETFDSGATPKPGEERRQPKMVADIDLDAFRARLSSTIEKVKLDDPRELRRQIAELKADNQALRAKPGGKEIVEVVKEVPVMKETDWKRLEQLAKTVSSTTNTLLSGLGKLTATLDGVLDEIRIRGTTEPRQVPTPPRPALPRASAHDRALPTPRRAPALPAPQPQAAVVRPAAASGELAKCPMALLTAIAQLAPDPATRSQIAMLSGYPPSKSTFRGGMAALINGGYVYVDGVNFILSPSGTACVGPLEPRRTGAALLDWWQPQLPAAARALLTVLVSHYPDPCSREQLGQLTGYDPNVSTFRGGIAALKTFTLITGASSGPYRASDMFASKRKRTA